MSLATDLGAQDKQDTGLDSKISVQLNRAKLIELFDAITLQTGLYFSYDPLVKKERPV